MLVEQSLSVETIEIAEKVDSVDNVIQNLSAKVADVLGVDAATIEQAVLDRERVRTTAFPNGAAIPHCRLPKLKTFAIALMVLRQPVRWDNEGHAVDTAVLIAGPTESVSDHLRILANTSQLLDSAALRAKLKAAPDASSAHKLLVAAETALEERRSQVGMLRELRRGHNGGSTDHLSDIAEQFDW